METRSFSHTVRMPRQADLYRASQPDRAGVSDYAGVPMPQGGQESARENLKAVLALAKLLELENKTPVR